MRRFLAVVVLALAACGGGDDGGGSGGGGAPCYTYEIHPDGGGSAEYCAVVDDHFCWWTGRADRDGQDCSDDAGEYGCLNVIEGNTTYICAQVGCQWDAINNDPSCL
jgi:hypothetical protein